MKKSLLALAALTAFAGVASAQSSVTLFGVVDVNARNVKNSGGSIKSLSTDGWGSSRIGLRGVEDLGGGLRAGFWLEGSVGADTGTGAASLGNGSNQGQTWQRRSTVSLIGGFGEIRLGRDYTPDFWNHTVFDPFGTNGVASSFNVYGGAAANSGVGTLVRANNSIGYFLPAGIGGLYGQVMVAAGEGATGNKHMGARLGYSAGPVNVAVAYGRTDVSPNTSDDYKRLNVGASWNLGFMRLMGYWVNGERTAGQEVTQYLVGGILPFGASQFKFAYTRSDGKGPTAANNAQDATQIGLGYGYSMSKRTTLYAHYARVNNKSGAAYTASGSGPAGHMAGRNSTGYEFGVNHTF
jgi:predicted porin